MPFAFNSLEEIINPNDANKSVDYFCPSCGDLLILKKGDVRVPHFSHKATDVCTQETITHKIAKLLIQKIIRDWKRGLSSIPTIKRHCKICGDASMHTLSDNIEDAILERKLDNGFIVDVLLIERGTPNFGVEIQVTHAVDDNKHSKMNIPFVELNGFAIIENALNWEPIKDNLSPFTCEKCLNRFEKFKIKTNEISKKANLTLPNSYYRYSFCDCWNCREEILVFAWNKDGMHSNEEPKQKPIPRILQNRNSAMAGTSYWVNVCPYCNRIQGDFFLYMEPDGAFFGFCPTGESQKEFENDLMQLAYLAFRYEEEPTYFEGETIQHDHEDIEDEEIKEEEEVRYDPLNKKAPCQFCGIITDDWVYYDGAHKICTCRDCSRKGKV